MWIILIICYNNTTQDIDKNVEDLEREEGGRWKERREMGGGEEEERLHDIGIDKDMEE